CLLAFFTLTALATSTHAQEALPAGIKPLRLSVEGIQREAFVYAPASAKTTRTPVVFAFHGHNGSAAAAVREYAMHRAWPEAITVCMQGLDTPGRFIDKEGKQSGWQQQPGNQGDRDLKFFDAMLAHLKQAFQIDDKRIYAFGHSGGGYFVYLLWAARGGILAAVAPLASEAAENLPSLNPKPALCLAGENDPRVKYEWQRASMNALRQLNGCAAEGTPWGEHCTLFPSATGTPVVEFIHPGGHELPKGTMAAIARFFNEQAGRQRL
ncbi:MAG: esterase, partial [Verrucomicrobiaceae bacterium]|nr:esterase [Verrucomicrobiaceae bacterium]